MDKRLDDYDWAEVFRAAGEETDQYGSLSKDVTVVPPGAAVSDASFTREDVAAILWYREGENDGDEWLIGGRLNDGRFFWISAWCDYTGWGCQDGGEAFVAATREDIIRFGMGNIERDAFGITINDQEEIREVSP